MRVLALGTFISGPFQLALAKHASHARRSCQAELTGVGRKQFLAQRAECRDLSRVVRGVVLVWYRCGRVTATI